MYTHPLERVRFGDFELDLRTGELRSIEAPDPNNKVLLREQMFQVMRMLVECEGQIVSREEIKSRLWGNDTIIDFDQGINSTIKALRRALGDSAGNPRYIETLGRRGYRLMPTIEYPESTSGTAPGQPTAEEPLQSSSLTGRKVSHYRVLDVIGGGGMGVVFKAEDLKLGRLVALKFLPEEFGGDAVALKRFEREAQTASALSHPNICTIYEIEEHEGRAFIAMELLQGDNLRDRLSASKQDSLPLPELLQVSAQICDGLQAAHDKGIIHRDIKPANLFLCKSGAVKILDFGLAKLAGSELGLERAESASTTVSKTSSTESLKKALTRSGATAGYMSPEQVRNEELDTRSDLFSFGLVVYEMACGQRAFTGETLVDVHEAILHQPFVSARARNPVLPRSLDLVLAKALEKDRNRRYKSAKAMKDDLARINRETHPTRGLIRRALTAGVLLVLGALCAWRYELYRHRITLAPTDTIVLADVDNRTSDPVFDGALNAALRCEMEQTPYLNLLGLDKTYATMGQLNLEPTTKITPEIARQICRKTNSKMVISDSIADAGNRYHLEMRALDCGSGATLAEEQTDIATRGQVVHQLGQTGARLRTKLGEPAQSVARFNQPLEKATSASLEALQTGAEGTKLFLAGNPQAALPLYHRGIELDPDLALTSEGIGAANEALGHFDLEKSAFTRAYQLRDRMTEKDRLNTEYLYYSDVTGELDKSHSVLVKALELFPRDIFFHNNLAITLARLGEPNHAAELEDETARSAPSTLYFSWAAVANMNASRFSQAKSWLAQAKAYKFDSLELSVQEYRLAFIEGDQHTIDTIFEDETHGPNRTPFLRERSKLEALQGRLESADHLLQQASRLSADAEQTSQALVFSALQDAEAGRVLQARNAEDQALQSKLDRNRKMVLALALARSGRTEEAARLTDEVSHEAPLDTIVQKYLVPTVRGAIQLHKHNPAASIDLLRGTVKYDLAYTESFYFLYPAYIRGLAYLESGDGRSAAGEFQKLIDNPGLCWGFTSPLARLQLARAERLMGDSTSSRKFYEEFLSLWKSADPDLPVYRQAKAEYAQLKNLGNQTR